MNTAQFDHLLESLGKKYLQTEGFSYKNKEWNYKTDDYQLSLGCASEKHAAHFKIRYLTVSIYRYPDNYSGNKGDVIENMSDNSCIQISPDKLEAFVKQSEKDKGWHYVNPRKSKNEELVFLPVYYGGLEGDVDINSARRVLSIMGMEPVDESLARETVEEAFIQTAHYAKRWAEEMTIDEMVRQIETYGEGWWIEKNWVKLLLSQPLDDL